MTHRKYGRATIASTMSVILATVAASSGFAQESADADEEFEEITVTGIRSSLRQAMDQKRDSRGVVDAISSEDMGKFPDTNLAEALQRITGVSIDRENGEGARVTVRGFGPDFNLVTLNGRQMPTSTLLGGGAPASRSFDFGNLAAEGIAGVQVYKTSRAAVPTGGIGSTINIQTTKPLNSPGLKMSIGAKGVYDTSAIESKTVTPEISGIFSNTFADDKFGVALTGSYQKRESGFAQASVANGWRGAYLGSDNNWGTLPQIPDGGTEADVNITNRPGPNDVYAVQQSLGYAINDIDRERINGQLTLQYRPVDSITATLDYTYSENKVATKRNDVSVWFNFGDTTSEWTDGPVAGPVFYTERFGGSRSDLAMGGARFAVKSENKSIGINLEWLATDNLTLELDLHDSSAESGQNSPYGTTAVLGTGAFILDSQSVNYENPLPVLTIGTPFGENAIDAASIVATGSVFGNSFMRDDIRQAQIKGSYEFDDGIIESIDFGATYTENKVQSAFANAQRDTWGGAGPASDIPDDIFVTESIPDKFDAFDGADDPNLLPNFFTFDFDRMVGLIDSLYNACGGDGICRSDDFTTDRRTTEESYGGYVQVNASWDVGYRPANLVAGLRYEKTDIVSRALVPIATGTQWVAANEFGIIFGSEQDFTELEGSYEHWLPAIDFDIEVRDGMIFRASYSETITRPSYADIQGGQTVSQLFRVEGGQGNQGDPGLLPFKSKNLDFSLEYYYDDASYIAAGFFNKNVDNFIGISEIRDTPFNLPTPFGGQRYNDAVAALGSDQDLTAIRNYIFANADPSTVQVTGVDANGDTTGFIFGVPGEDPVLGFDITVPVNQRSATVNGWEFALQHTFGDSGFGGIVNYTIVSGDVDFDITQPASVPQFALVGLSDTANVIAFYDKDRLQARVAYNWRDKFLASTATAAGPNNPMFTEAFWQIDANISYDVLDNLTVFVEGINITGETQRLHGRNENTVHFATQTGARYMFGARYKF